MSRDDFANLKPISAIKFRAAMQAKRDLYASQLALASAMAGALEPLEGKPVNKGFATRLKALPGVERVLYNPEDYGGDATVKVCLAGEAIDSYRNVKLQLEPAGAPYLSAYVTDPGTGERPKDSLGRVRYSPNASYWLNGQRIKAIDELLETNKIEQAVAQFNTAASSIRTAFAILAEDDLHGHSAQYMLKPDYTEVRE